MTQLIIVGRFEEVNSIFNSEITLEDNLKDNIILAFYTKIILLICEEKYVECNMLYLDSSDRDIEIMMFLKKKLNILEDRRRDIDSYFQEQLIDYKEGSFFTYMNKYISGKGSNSINHFKEDFPLREVYRNLREILPNEKKVKYWISC